MTDKTVIKTLAARIDELEKDQVRANEVERGLSALIYQIVSITGPQQAREYIEGIDTHDENGCGYTQQRAMHKDVHRAAQEISGEEEVDPPA